MKNKYQEPTNHYLVSESSSLKPNLQLKGLTKIHPKMNCSKTNIAIHKYSKLFIPFV